MNHIKIKGDGKSRIEIAIDGKPVNLRYLKSINLDMTAGEANVLTLEYHVKNVDIDIDNVEVEVEKRGYY